MKRNIILTVFSLLLLCGCSDDMERIQTGTNTEELIYADAAKTRQILNNLYARTRLTQGSFSCFSGDGVTFLDCATDNGYAPIEYSTAHTHGKSTMSASNIAMNGGDPWTFYYNNIRNATLFMQKVDGSVLSEEEKASSKVQARFLRALYYAELYRWYGGVVLLGDEIISPIDLNHSRSSADETVNYIISEMAAVASQLPQEWDAPNYGRATSGAALAYIARTRLYAASKLNNPSMDKGKWEAARDALAAVINLGIYDLYYDPENRELSYARYFCERKSKENIYTYLLGLNNTMHSNMPQGAPWTQGTYVGCVPTQNLIDAYDMKDGTEPIIGYDTNGQPIINPTSGYDDAAPYENRDPRLKMTIFYHGNTFDLDGNQTALDITTVDAKSQSSGYLVLKYLDDRIGHKSTGNTVYNCNPQMIRYAEILLGYAETLNELGSTREAIRNMNLIRKRAGVGELEENKTWSKEELRERIYKEYRIEFAFEDNRFFDARRWAKAEEWFSKSVYKVNISGGLTNPIYTRTLLEERIFLPKCYRFPIPQKEIDNCPNIEQNTGW